jgi:hypothetical protein
VAAATGAGSAHHGVVGQGVGCRARGIVHDCVSGRFHLLGGYDIKLTIFVFCLLGALLSGRWGSVELAGWGERSICSFFMPVGFLLYTCFFILVVSILMFVGFIWTDVRRSVGLCVGVVFGGS